MIRVTVRQGHKGAFHEVDDEVTTESHWITRCGLSIRDAEAHVVVGEVGCKKCIAVGERVQRVAMFEMACWAHEEAL